MHTSRREPSTFTPPGTAARPELCVTCGNEIATPFCAYCGEKRASDRAYSVWEFIKDHVVESVMNFDGRAIRTFKALVRRPGELTREFMRGSRLPYLQPLQLFLLLNLAFFLWSSAAKIHIFDTQLRVHVQGMPYSSTAKRLVIEKLRATGQDQEVFASRFDTVGTAQARSLVIVMVPALALAVWLIALGSRRRRPMVQHLVFALHTFAFAFVLMPVAIYLIGYPLGKLLIALGVKGGTYGFDAQYSAILALIVIVYLTFSFRRAYELSRGRAIVSAILTTAALGAIVQAYRGLLFFVTYYSM